MRVWPVLDLRAGVVVRGVGGRRSAYQPVVSRLTSSSRPVDVAVAIRDHFGLEEFYLADLDALAGGSPDLETYRSLHTRGIQLWVDAGLREVAEAACLAEAGVEGIVAGLETVAGPEVLADLVQIYGAERVLFSLDLANGRPLGDLTRWRQHEPCALAAEAVAAGVRRLLVLDLARVGLGGGTGTEDLCTRLTTAHPQVWLAAGGGVRSREDLQRLQRCGVQAALVASALHDGRLDGLRREDFARL